MVISLSSLLCGSRGTWTLGTYGKVRSGLNRSEGSSPIGAEYRATYLYSVDPEDRNHDAVMRIDREAPGW